MRHETLPARPRKGGAPRIAAALLCGALLGAAGLAAKAGAGAGEIVAGKSVGEIRVGMAVGELLKLWGVPERTERDAEGVTLYDYGTKRGVGVFVDGDRVSQIMVVSPDWTTNNGLKVGVTRPEVLAFYGRPDEEFGGQTQDELRFWYRRRGIVFILKDRVVAGITVLAAEVPEAPKGLDPDDPALSKPFLPTPEPSPLTR